MPTFQIVTGALDSDGRRHLAGRISVAAAEAGQPIDAVTVAFIEPKDVFVRGGRQVAPERFARVDVTIGGLNEAQRRALARAVCGLLCDAGVEQDAMTLVFHDANGQQVAVGRGSFPFWPESAG
jgi:phenylpyruvate tautomerase PptA (4-oxalocrotonate tautomerase family)